MSCADISLKTRSYFWIYYFQQKWRFQKESSHILLYPTNDCLRREINVKTSGVITPLGTWTITILKKTRRGSSMKGESELNKNGGSSLNKNGRSSLLKSRLLVLLLLAIVNLPTPSHSTTTTSDYSAPTQMSQEVSRNIIIFQKSFSDNLSTTIHPLVSTITHYYPPLSTH